MKEALTTGSPLCAFEFEKRNPDVEIKHLVKLMIEDPVLLKNWTQLSDCLGSHPQHKARWERGINSSNMKHYDVFSEMLQNWALAWDNLNDSSSTGSPKRRTVQDLCSELRKALNCNALAETIELKFGTFTTISNPTPQPNDIPHQITRIRGYKTLKRPITFGLKLPAQNFTGRTDELKTLYTYFNNPMETNAVLVCGIGGIGKTELCRKFANYTNYYKVLGINVKRWGSSISRIWLHGETLETLRDSVLQLACKLGVTVTTVVVNISGCFEYLASLILENCSRLLVILDNFDVKYEEGTKLIKTILMTKNAKKMFIVVTSRNSMVLDGASYTMKLDVLLKQEAMKMLKTSVDFSTEFETEKLCELLQYFPLALQQAVAYIKHQRNHFRTANYSVSDYVDEFEVKKSEMLDHKLNEFEHDYSMTTLVTWDMTIGKITQDAVDILKIVAHLEADGVELDFLAKICENNLTNFDETVELLHYYSLVKIENGKLSTHRLVQEIMRGKIENQVEYCKTLFQNVLLNSRRFEKFNKKGPSQIELVQLNSVSRFAWKCEVGYDIQFFHELILFLLERDLIDCVVQYIKLNYQQIEFGNDIDNLGAVEVERIVTVILGGIFYEANEDILTNGMLLIDDSNKVPLDRKSLEVGLKISQRYLGDRSKLTFAITNQLAIKFYSDREFDKVVVMCENLTQFSFDEEQKEVFLKTINKLMPWLYKKPISVIEKFLTTFVYVNKLNFKVMEVTDFNIMTKEEIENEFSAIDYSKISVKMLEKILPLYKEVLGDAHSLTVKVKNAIAWELREFNSKRCIKLLEQVLDSHVHKEYKRSVNTLYWCYLNEQRKIVEDVLEGKRLTLGETHSDLIRIKQLLAKMQKVGCTRSYTNWNEHRENDIFSIFPIL